MINASIIALSMLLGSGDEIVVIVDDVPTVRVSIAGLDLTSNADRLTIERRILRAARNVCSVHYLPAITWYDRLACQQDSLADARTKLDRAIERHAGRDGLMVAGIAVTAAAPSAR